VAGHGPAPKAHRQRARDERRRQADQTVVKPDNKLRGPDLDPASTFGPVTVAFYDKIRRSPQAQAYEDTDWLMVTDVLLPLHDAFTTGTRKSAAMAAEIRQIMSSLGATVLDRQRARITIDRENTDSAPSAPARSTTKADLQRELSGK
jgi:hypothetical protein